MTSFTIIGTGKMGDAIGRVLAHGGGEVDYVDHASAGAAAIAGEVVVLAVPYPALDDVVATFAKQLAGKTVVDITNPIDFATLASSVPVGSSATSELQQQLPDSVVLKAFNTNLAPTLVSKQTGGIGTTVLIAGDDDEAKSVLAAAVTGGGLEAVDVGTQDRARDLESLGLLLVTLAVRQHIGRSGGFAVVK